MFLRKYVDYFCELAATSDNLSQIQNNDTIFAASPYWDKVKWVSSNGNDIYVPTYNDILRVVSLIEFNRGKLGDLVALLSGRDFEERDYKKEIEQESFEKLESGIDKFTNKSNFEHFVQDVLVNLGFKGAGLLIPQNAINYSYAMYLRNKNLGVGDTKLKNLIRRLFVISLLTERHSGSFESRWTSDFQRMQTSDSLEELVTTLERQNFTDIFWTDTLPSRFNNTIITASCWTLYTLSQKRLGSQSFLTSTLVRDMTTAQVHHIYPREYLKKNGYPDTRTYNRLANYVYLHDQINNKIKDSAPERYMEEICKWDGAFGNEIKNETDLKKNLNENAIPELVLKGVAGNYLAFLEERAKLMSLKIKEYYYSL
jgi:hypothetical protein